MVISSARSSRRARGLGVLAAIALCMGLAACGGGSSASTTASAIGPGGILRDTKLVACLKQHGFTLPSRPRGGFRRRGGGGTGTGAFPALPPGATTPSAAQRERTRSQFAARFAKLRAALQACGAKLPAFGGRGAGRFRGRFGSTTPTAPPGVTSTPSTSSQ